MQYSQQVAEQVASIHNISVQTLTTWKFRNKIPEKYFDENGHIVAAFTDKASDADKYMMLKLAASGHLNFSGIKSISIYKLADVRRGKAALLHSEYIEFKKEMIDLKNNAAQFQKSQYYDRKMQELGAFLCDPRLKPYTFADNSNRRHLYCIERLTKKGYFDDVNLVEQTMLNVSLFLQSIIL